MAGDLTDLVAWRESALLAAEVMRVSGFIRGPGARDAKDQILRAAMSIPANVAEGYGRGRVADGVRFLRIARGSAVELESHLRVAQLAGQLNEKIAASLIQRTRRVRALIGGLIRTHAC